MRSKTANPTYGIAEDEECEECGKAALEADHE
jgi:hypothetical protein